MRIVLDAPPLGLRPPVAGTIPSCYKLVGALRDCGLRQRISAADAGYVTPPRYVWGDWQPGEGVFNAQVIATYISKLADRIGVLLAAEQFRWYSAVTAASCLVLP